MKYVHGIYLSHNDTNPDLRQLDAWQSRIDTIARQIEESQNEIARLEREASQYEAEIYALKTQRFVKTLFQDESFDEHNITVSYPDGYYVTRKEAFDSDAPLGNVYNLNGEKQDDPKLDAAWLSENGAENVPLRNIPK